MPSFSDFANLELFDRDTDKDQLFLDFRDAIAGTNDSNMQKIDALFESQNASILINVTLVFDSTNNTYIVTGVPQSVGNIYSIRFMMPKDYIAGETFTINNNIYQLYTPRLSPLTDGAWKNNSVITANVNASVFFIFSADGIIGESATINIGTTNTVDYGAGSSVSNSGTDTNAVLDFTLERGPTGHEGPQGPPINVDTVEYTLAASDWVASSDFYVQTVTLSATAQNGFTGISANATKAQVEALRNALLRITGYTNTTISFAIDGDLPTIDIPMALINF